MLVRYHVRRAPPAIRLLPRPAFSAIYRRAQRSADREDRPGEVRKMPSSTRPSSARATCAGRTEPAGGFELLDHPGDVKLLVDWLSELLYRATSGYCVFVAFQIQELGDTQLKAAAGVVAAAAIEDIKAVTHHELSIREEDRGWEATVVFDI